MLKFSYLIILGGILAMVIASVLLYLDSLTTLAYAMLVAGFLGVGGGILLGFFRMIREEDA